MAETLTERLTATPEGMRLYQQERAILDLTELVCEIMEEQGVSRSDLARRLDKTKGYVTQLLDGRANMTVRTMSDVFGVLGRAIHFQDGPLSVTVQATPLLSIQEGLGWAITGAWPEDASLVPEQKPVGERLVG